MSGGPFELPEGFDGDAIRKIAEDPEFTVHVLTEIQKKFESHAQMTRAMDLLSTRFEDLTPAIYGNIVSGLHDLKEVLEQMMATLRMSAMLFDDPKVLEIMAQMVDDGTLEG